MRKIQFDSFVWIDINPDLESDLETLENILNLKESTEQILKSPIHLQRFEEYPDYMAVVLHYPLYNKDSRKNVSVEIDVILTHGYLVTAHRQELHFLKDIHEKLSHRTIRIDNPVTLYMNIVETMLDACMMPLNRIAEKIDYIEEEIFRGNERGMISEISFVKRDVLDFRKIIRLHKAVIDSSFKLIPSYFPDAKINQKDLSDILATNTHIWNITENLKEAIEAFDDTNQTLLSHKLNENIKTLTIFSTTLAPASLLAAILGMNANMEFLQSPYAFFVVIAALFTLTATLYIYFKRKDVI